MQTKLFDIILMASPGGKSNGSMTLILLGGMMLVMWLFMIRPQSKKAKLQKQFNEGIRSGDKIVTIAGIHGRVNKVNEDNTLQIEIAPSTYMTIERSAISMEYTQTATKKTEAKA